MSQLASCLALLLLVACGHVSGLVIPPRQATTAATTTTTSTTSLKVWFPNEGMEVARNSFPLWMFGAAGSGGVARSTIPRLIDEYKELQQLGTTSKQNSSGEPTVGLSPLSGYPNDISVAEVEKVIRTSSNIAEIVAKYPVTGNFLAEKGYLTFDAFEQANAGADPLAVRAVFESFAKPKCVEPDFAQAKIDSYKRDVYQVAANLLRAKLIVYFALAALLFLLGLADVATATDFCRGWFPDWPGAQNFPQELLTEKGSLFAIPDYFLWDVPPERMLDR